MELKIIEVDKALAIPDKLELSENAIKVPEVVYQILADIAQQYYRSLGARQQAMMKVLNDWVEDKFPGMQLNAFIDLSNKNVALLEARGVTGVSWGMYIQIRPADNSLGYRSVPLTINNIQNLLE